MAATITWQEFREAAEHAHGMQHSRLGIYHDGKNIVVEAYESARASEYVFETVAEPAPVKAGRLKVCLQGINAAQLQKRLRKPLSHDLDVFDHADAVLWSLPAVEKFLVPYYASYMELEDVIKEIRDRFADAGVLAYIHLPNSEVVDDGPDTLIPTGNAPTLFALEPDKKDKSIVNLVPIL